MALTFSHLRTRNTASLDLQERRLRENEALLAAAEAPARQQIQSRIRYARRRLEDLLSDRIEIESLASSQPQIEAYGGEQGPEKWHGEFTMLRNLDSNPNVKYEGEALRHYVWSKVPNSRFKRFQELFSRPEHLIVPHFEILPGGDVRFEKSDFNAMSLAGCLVSPDRIPDQLAEDLKLCDFTEENGDPFARLRKKATIIPELKKIWESARQLQKGHHRLLAVENPAPEIEERYPDTRAIDPSTLGTVLYVREYENGNGQKPPAKNDPPPPRTLVVNHFGSVYGAHRKTWREEISYNREITALTEMLGDIAELNRRIDTQWKDEALRDDLRASARTISAQCVERLSACENKYKVQARDLIGKFGDLKDMSGKENVTAALSRMVAAINRFGSRFEDMDPKGGFNQRDRMVLQRQIKAHEKGLADYRGSVQSGSKHLGNGLALLNPAVVMNDRQRESNVSGIERRLDLDPSRLSHIQLQPFRTYRDKLAEEYGHLHTSLESRDRTAVIGQAVKMHVIGKYQEVRACFEQVKEFTMDAENVPVSKIRTFVSSLRNVFAERQIFPEHTVESYQAPFEEMARELGVIEKRLAYYENKDLDVGSRTEIYKNLKAYIDKFDIEEIVRSLS